MIEEPFSSGDSLLHRIDPRFRVIGAACFSCVVAACDGFPALIVGLIAALSALLLSRPEFHKLMGRLAVVNVFILFFWAILPFTCPGGRIWSIGPVEAHLSGILLAARLTLKSNAIVLALIALIATMPLATLGHALSRLKVPGKLVFLFMLTYRYIFVIGQEYQKIMRSLKVRGFVPNTSLHTYKTYAYVVGMLLIRASERADRVYDAMRCRGFKGTYHSLAEFSADRKSRLFLLLSTGASIAIAAMEVVFDG